MNESQETQSSEVQINFLLGQIHAMRMFSGLLMTCLEKEGLIGISGKMLRGMESAEFHHMMSINFSPPPWSKPGETKIGADTPESVPVGFNEGVSASLSLLRKMLEKPRT